MAPLKKKLTLSPLARADLKDILKYTHVTWGAEQREKYKFLLDSAMRRIASHPELGGQRKELGEGYRSHHVGNSGRHVIYYRVLDDAVIVIRVLHDSMDVIQHIP